MNNKIFNPMSSEAQSLKVGGRYRHYKGMEYKVIALARHSETLEELVVYQALYGDFGFWVRPVRMFLENVEIQGKLQRRFQLIQNNF